GRGRPEPHGLALQPRLVRVEVALLVLAAAAAPAGGIAAGAHERPARRALTDHGERRHARRPARHVKPPRELVHLAPFATFAPGAVQLLERAEDLQALVQLGPLQPLLQDLLRAAE